MRTDKDARKVMVTYALCALALSEVINLNIVSVALPNLMGALGANIDNISLTMTSYMVAAAICMPLSGMVINKFGMKRVALIAIIIFTLFTILCGTATNLLQMVIYRTLQGVGGAFFPAMAQAYIVNNFHEEMRQKNDDNTNCNAGFRGCGWSILWGVFSAKYELELDFLCQSTLVDFCVYYNFLLDGRNDKTNY